MTRTCCADGSPSINRSSRSDPRSGASPRRRRRLVAAQRPTRGRHEDRRRRPPEGDPRGGGSRVVQHDDERLRATIGVITIMDERSLRSAHLSGNRRRSRADLRLDPGWPGAVEKNVRVSPRHRARWCHAGGPRKSSRASGTVSASGAVIGQPISASFITPRGYEWDVTSRVWA